MLRLTLICRSYMCTASMYQYDSRFAWWDISSKLDRKIWLGGGATFPSWTIIYRGQNVYNESIQKIERIKRRNQVAVTSIAPDVVCGLLEYLINILCFLNVYFSKYLYSKHHYDFIGKLYIEIFKAVFWFWNIEILFRSQYTWLH